MDSFRKANIYVCDQMAGILTEADDGYHFKYDEIYLATEGCRPVSLTLPLQTEEYVSSNLFPFFDGLIPEGWLLDVVVKNWKIDIRDRFGLLLVACNDCIGNVSVREVRG